MKRAAKQIAVGAVLLLVLCIVCRFSFFRSYTVYYPLYPPDEEKLCAGDIRIEAELPGIVRTAAPELRGNMLALSVFPEQPGETFLTVLDGTGRSLGHILVKISRFLRVYEANTGGFSGDTAVILAATLFWFFTGAVMLWNYFQNKGPAFYQLYSVYFAGFSLFAFIVGLSLLEVALRHLLNPAAYSMLYVYSAISGASSRFMKLTSPLFLAFAVAMAVSNIVLLRHTRIRPQNILGLLVSFLLILGLVIGLYLSARDFSGSEWEGRIQSALENTFATAFVYFECMLAGSVFCGIRASKHEPSLDKDFIVILGCWFRKDGTLPPLLRGRADRALAFWQDQKEAAGKEARFIPSGGQGPDESMPEAEAIRRYLLSRNVPDRLIFPETASKNTLENMAFSRKIIQEINPEGKTVFATTNYHLFRSGVWASAAGLQAEGIGSRSKWWYWPNAYMRETIGLLQKRWKQEILLLILLLIFFIALTMLLG
ncbi:MAG: YdcF family protein [Clostridia bacterium]|nr:YdcF family protein [Clostridia bacterium]